MSRVSWMHLKFRNNVSPPYIFLFLSLFFHSLSPSHTHTLSSSLSYFLTLSLSFYRSLFLSAVIGMFSLHFFSTERKRSIIFSFAFICFRNILAHEDFDVELLAPLLQSIKGERYQVFEPLEDSDTPPDIDVSIKNADDRRMHDAALNMVLELISSVQAPESDPKQQEHAQNVDNMSQSSISQPLPTLTSSPLPGRTFEDCVYIGEALTQALVFDSAKTIALPEGIYPKCLIFAFRLVLSAANRPQFSYLTPVQLVAILNLLSALLNHELARSLLETPSEGQHYGFGLVVDALYNLFRGVSFGLIAPDPPASRQNFDGEATTESQIDVHAERRNSLITLSTLHRVCMLTRHLSTLLQPNEIGLGLRDGLSCTLSHRPLPEHLRCAFRAAVVAVARVLFVEVHSYSLLCNPETGEPSRLAATVIDGLMTPDGEEFR